MSLPIKIKAASLATAATTALAAPKAFASEILNGANAAKGGLGNQTITGAGGLFSTITNVLIFLVGAISVIVLILAGLRYVTSAGNAAQVQGAKNTILYAVVGIVVAIMAYAIVNFVITQIS